MKFVYFGYDFMLDAVQRLIADGHELLQVFTFPCDNHFNFNVWTYKLAQDRGIPIQEDRPSPADIETAIKNGAECFLSAGYLYKIPPISEDKAYAINLHPSLLPRVRGMMPTPYLILEEPDAGGLTAHKLSAQFDQGDILDQVALPIGSRETVETYSARISMAAPDLLSRILADLPEYWKHAKPQDENAASYYPPPDNNMRLLDFSQIVDRIDARARAFGRYGSLAQIDGKLCVIYGHAVWKEAHDMLPGTVAHELSREKVIAAADGFVCLTDYQILEIVSP